MRSQPIGWPALVFCTVASLVPASLLLAQNPNMSNPGANPNQPNPMNRPMTQNAPIPDASTSQVQDKMFLRKAAEGGMAEVQLGKLAAQKGSSAEVKEYGQKMVEDHTKLNDQMKPIAASLAVPPPQRLNKSAQAEYDKLEGLSGDAFDQEYITAMVKDHRKDLHEFRQQERMTSNSDVKAAISQAEPVISQHLNMIQDIAQQKGITVPEGHHEGNPAGAPPVPQ